MYECAQSSITPNNLNLPVYDLHSREARDQILMNFHTLSQTSSTISQRHMKKCSEQRQRIEQLRERVMKCKERIETLSGMNQAIVFVSPGQYPKKYEFDISQKKSNFSDLLQPSQLQKMDMQAQYIVKHDIKELGQDAKLKIKDLQQFVLFLFGKLKGKRKTVFQKGISNKKQIQSLGKIPNTIRYIDSLTVFNTHINPYRKYEVVNNKFKIEEKKNKDAAVPETNDAILHPITDFKKQGLEADFTPYRKGEQELDMPDFAEDLDLLGVVGLDTAVNDDTTNFANVKKKTVVKDTLAGKKESPSKSTSGITQNSSQFQTEQMKTPQRSAAPSMPTASPPSRSKQASLPPPPPPASNLPPPPPPAANLPPPPPPPPGGLLPPPPPPPKLSAPVMSSPPPAASGDRNALLSQLNTSNPISRLKRTVTIEKGTVDSMKKMTTMPSIEEEPSRGGPGAPPPGPMSFLDQIKIKVAQRFVALHPQRESQNEDADD